MDTKHLEILQNNEHFLSFLEEIRAQREGWIAQLHDRPTDTIQQLAGRICALDDVLNAAGYEACKARWDSLRR